MVAPTTGPRTTPSRTAMRAGRAREVGAHLGEFDAAAAAAPGALDTTRSSAGSPRTTKLRMLTMPTCGVLSCVGGSIATHIWPPNMRGYMSVKRNSAPASSVSK